MTWYNPVDDFHSGRQAAENALQSINHGASDAVDATRRLFDSAYEKAQRELSHASPQINEAVKKNFLWRDGGIVITKDIPRLIPLVRQGAYRAAGGEVIKDGVDIGHDFAASVEGKMPTDCWALGQQMQGTLSTEGEGSAKWRNELDALDTLWDGSSKPPAYGATSRADSKFYDDNAWIGLDMTDAHKQNSQNPFYLQKAEQIFNFLKQGAETENMAHPGGVFWELGDTSRNAVSTGGATQLALELYRQTHDKQYLNFATKQFKWMDDTLKDRDGLYSDHIKADGRIDTTKYSYNQGLMLGNATLLYEETGDKRYLDEAKEIARKSLALFGQNGDGEFSKQAPMFGAVFFKNLMLLNSIEPNQAYRMALQKYAETLKTHLSDPHNKEDWPYLNPSPTNAYAGAEQVYSLARKNPV